MLKVLITGPESTGKSSLCKQLSAHFKSDWVQEYAREYLESSAGHYKEEDLINILNGQLEEEENKAGENYPFLFCDTGPEVILIWSEYKFNKVAPFIQNTFETHKYDLVLLLDVDLPWEPDPLREIPSLDERTKVLASFKKYLNSYQLISGKGSVRLEKAIAAVSKLAEKKSI